MTIFASAGKYRLLATGIASKISLPVMTVPKRYVLSSKSIEAELMQ